MLCLLATLLLCMTCTLAVAEGVTEEAVQPEAAASVSAVPEPYRLVTEGSLYNLYLREDYMAIVLENRETGALLYSTPKDESKVPSSSFGQIMSGVVTEYLAAGSSSISTQTVDLVTSGNTQVHTIEYTYLDNGFRAAVSYTAIGISYSVEVTLDGNDLTVSVPRESIQETMSPDYKLATLTLFPYMGACYLGEETGYMLIPDGQGALIELKDNGKRYRSLYFNEPVYGKKIKDDRNDAGNSSTSVDTEAVLMPVFGIAYTELGQGYISVIEEGDVAATIQAFPNGSVNLSYDRANAVYEYNYKFTQMMGSASGAGGMDATMPSARNFNIVQHFFLLTGEDACYAGMAAAYRSYLEEKGAFTNAGSNDFDVQLDVLGLEQENFVLGKQNVVMTTFEQAAAILAELREKGVAAMNVTLRGWQEGGLSAALPTDSYNPAGALGGKSGLTTLLEGAASRKIPLMLEADFLTANMDTHPTLIYSAFKKIDSQTWYRSTYGTVYATKYYVTPSKTADTAGTVIKQMKDAGIKGISLTNMTSFLSDYYEQSTIKDLTEMASVYSGVCQTASDTFEYARLQAANAYLWQYAGSLSDLPVTGSDYIFTTRDVPFLAITLSGKMPCYAEYTNFQANSSRFFLRLVEQGLRPSFLLTWEDPIELKNTNSANIYSSRYELYSDMIASWSIELAALHEKLGNASIKAHEVDGDLTHVTWTNGVQVWLNFGDEPLTVNGETLEAMSYLVLEGGE